MCGRAFGADRRGAIEKPNLAPRSLLAQLSIHGFHGPARQDFRLATLASLLVVSQGYGPKDFLSDLNSEPRQQQVTRCQIEGLPADLEMSCFEQPTTRYCPRSALSSVSWTSCSFNGSHSHQMGQSASGGIARDELRRYRRSSGTRGMS